MIPLLRRFMPRLSRHPDACLLDVTGLIHVGANTGQERKTYRKFGLNVIWIEPIPEVFDALRQNLRGYPKQRALSYLITDRDDAEYEFHVANNGGASSSIFDFGLHKEIWPHVAFEKSISLRSVTLASCLQKECINLADYQALILDTQGSELLVLKGAAAILSGFRFIKLEVSDFESYKGCCQLRDVEQFLQLQGYAEFSRRKFAERPGGGSYYNIVFQRVT